MGPFILNVACGGPVLWKTVAVQVACGMILIGGTVSLSLYSNTVAKG